MSVTEINEDFVHYRLPDTQGHFMRVGQWLSEERNSNNRRFVDIEFKIDGQADYMHSVVAIVHSHYLRQALMCRRTPLTINMSGFRARSVFKVIDWMYNGSVELCKTNIGEHLAVTAFLGVKTLHHLLEIKFRQMAVSGEHRGHCLNLATDERYQISTPVKKQLVADIAKVHDSLSTEDIRCLSVSSIVALVNTNEVTFNEKVDLLNLALLWLRFDENMRYIDAVLPHFSIQNLSTDSVNALVDHLRNRLVNSDAASISSLHVYSKNNNTIIVSRDPKKFVANSGVVVTPIEEPETVNSCRKDDLSCKEGYQDFRFDMDSSQIREIQQLPDFERRIPQDRLERYTPNLTRSNTANNTDHSHLDSYFRPSKSESQKLINARMFPDHEVEEHNQLPSVGELFRNKDAVFRPGPIQGRIADDDIQRIDQQVFDSSQRRAKPQDSRVFGNLSPYFLAPSQKLREKKPDKFSSPVDVDDGMHTLTYSSVSANSRAHLSNADLEEIRKIPDVFSGNTKSQSAHGSKVNVDRDLNQNYLSKEHDGYQRGFDRVSVITPTGNSTFGKRPELRRLVSLADISKGKQEDNRSIKTAAEYSGKTVSISAAQPSASPRTLSMDSPKCQTARDTSVRSQLLYPKVSGQTSHYMYDKK